MDQDSAHMVVASKVLMRKTDEFEICRMRIKQYIQMMDYALWEVIENGATLPRTQAMDGVTTMMPNITVENAQRRLEVKTRSTLMMGIPNEHQIKINSIKDAKQLLEAVEKRFDLDTMSMDDLYNNLKVTNGVVNTANEVSTASTQVNATFSTNIDNLSDVVIYAFLASKLNSPQLAHKDLEQIHPDDIKDIDLIWQMAMLTIRARRFLKKTRRKLTVKGNETLSFDMSKVECYNCHKRGHFARECRAPRNQDFKHKESIRRTVPVETPASIALVSCDGLCGYDWSDQAEEGPNYALMAYTSTSSDSKVSDNEEAIVTQPKKEKKTVRPSIVKKECVKPSQQEKAVRKTVRQTMKKLTKDMLHLEETLKEGKSHEKDKNLLDHKVKVIRCDNRTEFKNREMNLLCEMKGTQSNGSASTKASNNTGQARKETEPVKYYILLSLWTVDPPFSQDPKSSQGDGYKTTSGDGKKVDEDPRQESKCKDQEKENKVNNTNNINTISLTVNAAGINRVNDVGELTFDPDMPALEDVGTFDFLNKDEDDDTMADINNLDTTIQVSPTPTTKIHKDHPLDQDEGGEEVDVYMYRPMIGSLMYLTSSRPDIMFAVYACARYQVNLNVSHLYAVKKFFRVDGKEIIITKSSVRRDLRLANEEGVDCFPNSTIFENLELIGLVRAVTTTFSLEIEQESGNIDKTQSKAIPNEASFPGTTSGGGPRCQEAIEDTISQTRFENVSKLSNDSLLVNGSSKRAGEELEEERSKKQKIDDDKETAKLKKLMEIIPNKEEVIIDTILLAVKFSKIVDWKIHKEGKKSYYQIIKVDGECKMYMVFNRMLKDFDREDLEDWYNLVKAKNRSTRPVEDLDLLLWGNLKTMFEPHVEDQGRIVGIKSHLNAVGITAAHIDVNTALMRLVLLVYFNEKYSK
uniref:CCHC-type domain-containing protein n=1 Tax=Tanacetum cinerariifolium TaxID=118510 RepID=A0A6L2LZW8_TANCI|nr:hypothetical protein [Tanacetum cinerariifolium]